MLTNWIGPRREAPRAVSVRMNPLWNTSPLDRFFDDIWRGVEGNLPHQTSSFSPKVNVEETDKELRLTAELPGLDEKDFEVSVEGDLLILKGEKKSQQDRNEEGYSLFERSTGSFRRSFRFGWDIDPDSVTASYRYGVLNVVVPRPEEEQPQVRTIPVTAA